jgi:hypothetical protein
MWTLKRYLEPSIRELCEGRLEVYPQGFIFDWGPEENACFSLYLSEFPIHGSLDQGCRTFFDYTKWWDHL